MATPPNTPPAPRSLHGHELRGVQKLPYGHPHDKGKFGRMFPYLDPRPPVKPLPADLGLAGGPMDGGAVHNDNPNITAGFTYLGQFIDHDITFDPTSSLEQLNDPRATENFRTPAFELDNVYGSGPNQSAYLYDRTQPGKLLLGPNPAGGESHDVPRNSQGTALIGDPRNDENLIVSQLHAAMLKFHNAVVDRTQAGPNQFTEAQQTVRWHYQWIVLHEFLPKIVGQTLVDDILTNGRKFYYWGKYPFIPVEFAVAAYRFGHSMVQPGYAINDTFGARLFDRAGGNDLSGGKPVPAARVVNWKNFFDTGVPAANRTSSKIDSKLAGPLLDLPFVPPGPRASLAFRNLQRGESFGLPSGQRVAERMGITPLTDAELWGGLPNPAQFAGAPSPLWFYVLREAEVKEGGLRLGPVGGRIVAEVFIGLLKGDQKSFLKSNPGFQPNLGPTPGKFSMVDLLTVAGVPTT